MKIYLTFISLLFVCPSIFSQNLRIVGEVTFDKSLHANVRICINDTIEKYYNYFGDKHDLYNEIQKDSTIFTSVNPDNTFVIYPKMTDTLVIFSSVLKTKRIVVSDYLKRKKHFVELEMKDCYKVDKCEEKQRLYAFVGKKIEVKYQEPLYECEENRPQTFNTRYKAKFEVLENVYGNLKVDTIEFTALDHYSNPVFARYETSLMYIVEYCGEFYHSKYQFQDLYQTNDGRWASPFYNSDYRYSEPGFPILPRRIAFKNPIIYKINDSLLPQYLDDFREKYPEPFFEIKGNEIRAMFGNYVDELFEMKKLTVLKSRGWFK